MKKIHIVFTLLLIAASIGYGFSGKKNDTTKPFVVVLDAGHGGKDSGNRGNGFYEKDIVLDVTLQVGRLLEKQPNIKVVYTRTTDVFVDLNKRGPIANKVDADIFVSIHCNSHKTQAYGVETFVMGVDKSGQNLETAKKENEVIFLEENYEETYAGFDPSSPESLIGLTLMQEEYLDQSILLAGLIQNNIINNLKRKDRSVKSAPFWVLHSSYMPSVLVELGFLTNNNEGPYVNSKKGRKELANEIANGILNYKKNISLATDSSQNPVITEEEIDKAIETTEKNEYKGVEFRVQLAASAKKLDTKPSNFKGLKDVDRKKEDGLYKYYYGETSDYNKIQLMKTFAQEKGYSSCYVVAFEDGRKKNLSEVLKSQDK
ncbi:N-acetylmuramoyl-L-alanine amidase family protein [Rasiella sp. SM2506]|uniref:N-acetylmuramoyl-L-alanine amidase family protein n=1 Tax=Rasiella sp. SM2506 TaxID=3423914 RepID=UPI003D7A1719